MSMLFGVYSKGKFGLTINKKVAIDFVEKNGGQVRYMSLPGGISKGDIPSSFDAPTFRQLSRVLKIKFKTINMNPHRHKNPKNNPMNLKAVAAAIRSKKTPKPLKEGLIRKYGHLLK